MPNDSYRESLVKGLTDTTAGDMPFATAAANVGLQQLKTKREEAIKEKDRLAGIETERAKRLSITTQPISNLIAQTMQRAGYEHFKAPEVGSMQELPVIQQGVKTAVDLQKSETSASTRLKMAELSLEGKKATIKDRKDFYIYNTVLNELKLNKMDYEIAKTIPDVNRTAQEQAVIEQYEASTKRLHDGLGIPNVKEALQVYDPETVWFVEALFNKISGKKPKLVPRPVSEGMEPNKNSLKLTPPIK